MSASTDLTGPLSEHPFLAGLSGERIRRLNSVASAEVLPAGSVIFREGERASRFYLIRRGRVSLQVHAPDRHHGIVADTLGDGDVLGWSWLLAPYRWAFDAHAAQLVQIIVLEAAWLRAEMACDAAFGMEILGRMTAVMGRRLAEARHCVVDHVVEPALGHGLGR